jgi:hypothetical protein
MACTHTAAMAVLAKLDVAFATERRVAAFGSAAALRGRHRAEHAHSRRRAARGAGPRADHASDRDHEGGRVILDPDQVEPHRRRLIEVGEFDGGGGFAGRAVVDRDIGI